MLLANCVVAEHLHKHCKDKAILRLHDNVAPERRENMLNYFEKNGLQVDMSDNIKLATSLSKLKDLPNGEDITHAVNRLFLANIKQAQYVCVENQDPEELFHYALNF